MQKRSRDTALTFLNRALHNGTWPSGTRLPLCKDLAAQANVSYTTMRNALGVLRKENKIIIKQKIGIFAGTSFSLKKQIINAKKAANKKRWEKIKDELYKDILAGEFHQAMQLPSIKELSVQYATGFTVIKKVINALEHEGQIKQEKKKYLIVQHVKQSSANTIYFFLHEMFRTNAIWNFQRDWFNIFIRSLETTCHHRNIRLVNCYYSNTIPLIADQPNVLGSIILGCAPNTGEYQDTLNLVATVKRVKKPLSLVFFEGWQKTSDSLLFNPKIESADFFISESCINLEAGKQVGRMLLSRGHRHICFFAPYSDVPAINERLQGLSSYFSDAGCPDGVIPFFSDKYPLTPQENQDFFNTSFANRINAERFKDDLGTGDSFSKRTLELLDPIDAGPTAAIQQLRETISTLYSSMDPVSTSHHKPNFTMVQGWKDMIEAHLTIYKMQLPHAWKTPHLNYMQQLNNNVQLQRQFFHIFKKALQLPHITAWVCAEDHLTNAAALEFCNQNKIKIPHDLGLIGFQDHLESCTNSITSYHFDFARLALKALNLVLYPKHSSRLFCKPGTNEFGVDGMVIDRGSV